MKCFLDVLLPSILPNNTEYQTIAHEGKQDLQKSIPRKLKVWNRPDTKFVIIQDQDSNDCVKLKQDLVKLCEGFYKDVLIRIACHELEARYFGDLKAVSEAYGKDVSFLAKKKQYRVPDDIINPKRELRKYLHEHQQISGAKKIAACMNVDDNTSVSFNVFVKGLKKLID